MPVGVLDPARSAAHDSLRTIRCAARSPHMIKHERISGGSASRRKLRLTSPPPPPLPVPSRAARSPHMIKHEGISGGSAVSLQPGKTASHRPLSGWWFQLFQLFQLFQWSDTKNKSRASRGKNLAFFIIFTALGFNI